MSTNPYRDMRKRKVVPIKKRSLFLLAAKVCGIAECERESERCCNPERVKALLKRVLGEDNLKHVHVRSSGKFAPAFEIDGITLTYHEGRKDVDDFFTVMVEHKDEILDTEEEEFELEEHRVRSMADLGSVLMLYADILSYTSTEYRELYADMQMSFLGIESNEDTKKIAKAQGEQIEPGQASIAGAAQIPPATMTLGAAINNQKRQKVRQA